MSRSRKGNRQAVLNAAWSLLRRQGATRVTMGDVARTAKLSRQAVYAHFPSRTQLMVALLEHVGDALGRVELFRPVAAAPTARQALETALRSVSTYNARIYHVAFALDLARHSDRAAASAWDDRMAHRRRRIASVVRRLAAEHVLRREWTARRATDAIFALSLPRLYGDLVVERGWSLEAYRRLLVATANALLR